MWRSMMNRKIMIVDVAEDEVEVDDVEDHGVKEEEDDDVETDGVEKEEDDDVEDDHVEAQDGTHTLCEPAQSKCTSTCHKSHFIRKFTGKLTPTTLCASLRNRNAHEHVTRAILYTDVYRNNAAPSWSTLIKHSPASTITVTTPQCKHRKYRGFWLPRRKKHRHGFLLREFREKKNVKTPPI